MIKTAINNMLLLFFGIAVALGGAEIVSRIFMPIFPGVSLISLDGHPMEGSIIEPSRSYRQKAHEYDAVTTITGKGFRGPAPSGAPDYLFVGDSFTFGQELQDTDAFPNIICTDLVLSCVNLGVPGASTIYEINRLEAFLEQEGWRPKEVFLFVMAMTTYLGAGNDLADNLADSQSNQSTQTESPRSPRLKDRIIKLSNFVRVVKYYVGPFIKSLVASSQPDDRVNEALKITGVQFARLDDLSKKFHFAYRIVLIHPVQDIMRKSDQETYQALQGIAPSVIIPTAQVFRDDPVSYYFPLDGHLNVHGSKKLAEYLKGALFGEFAHAK